MKKYPNHPCMPYELPIPWTPLGSPSDEYRDGWDRIFGPKCTLVDCSSCEDGREIHGPECPLSLPWRTKPGPMSNPPEDPPAPRAEEPEGDPTRCESCGELLLSPHRLERGVYLCEIES